MDAKRKPNVLWAQVSDKVFLTLDLQEAEKPNVQLLNDKNERGQIIFRYVYLPEYCNGHRVIGRYTATKDLERSVRKRIPFRHAALSFQ